MTDKNTHIEVVAKPWSGAGDVFLCNGNLLLSANEDGKRWGLHQRVDETNFKCLWTFSFEGLQELRAALDVALKQAAEAARK